MSGIWLLLAMFGCSWQRLAALGNSWLQRAVMLPNKNYNVRLISTKRDHMQPHATQQKPQMCMND